MTGYITEAQTVLLTREAADAVSDAVNARAESEAGVSLPPLVWVWNRGVFALPDAEGTEVEFRGRVEPGRYPAGVHEQLLAWAAGLRLTEITTRVEREHGRRTYSGWLAGSRIRISGRTDEFRTDTASV
ncbi:hypothetical protein LTV02_08550 [Nocardia yamanashiensis]|uniref:hypothetical protein n=1 Tax=Nocardia yamanashiensis TaxID=209247 RepID=UPI000834F29E|nr:hypothetical protein [Nocardia yamanashiensis]UGT43419.1 hypothetical protein LTV02_08550 [Nocardia yamanashiensis]